MIESIYHYTPNTAHGRWSPRSEVSMETIRTLAKILDAGKEILCGNENDGSEILDLGRGWQIANLMVYESGAIRWTICRYDLRLSYCWLMVNKEHADEMWGHVVKYADRDEVLCSRTCPELPILATLLVDFQDAPEVVQRAAIESGAISRDSMMELADLERCLAWTLLPACKT